MKILLFANTEWYLYNFRLSLIRAIREAGAEVVLVSPPGPYGERLVEQGFRWRTLPMERRSLNPLSELSTIHALTKIYREEKPDLVHHFTIKPVVYGSIAARLAGVPYRINAVTGLGHVFIDRGWLVSLIRPLVGVLLKLSFNASNSLLILQNTDDRDLFLANSLVDPQHIRIIRGSGVNTTRFAPRARQPLGDGRIRILLATRLLWEKGIEEYVAAARILRQEGVHAQFLLGGSADPGNPAAVSARDIEGWVQEGIIEALGHVDDMAAAMDATDIVVLPSYREGTPKVLLEAAASGLPIVTTDVPGCREVVENGINGLLVPPRNPVALAAAIRTLCTDADMRHTMGSAGRAKMLAEFDERLVIRKTMDAYRELSG